ncbi:MAG: aspartyl protease family protein [Chloroflexi bacterium]|nr:aspartyl protease family protein [Chloroflexota bacterium]
MNRFPYDTSYALPAPTCEIFLSSTRSKEVVGPLHAILDTGAEGTLIPQPYLDALGARPTIETGLRGPWGERRVVFLYLVNLRINDINLPGIYVVGDDRSSEIVIGRNVLNQLKISLDGPEKVLELSLGTTT